MLAYAAMAHTAVDEGKTMLAHAVMAHVGVDEEIDDDCIGGDGVRGRTGDGVHR